MKPCIKCQKIKPAAAYYRHSKMADGRLNACAECCKLAAKRRYLDNRDYIRAYERKRQQDPERRRKVLTYQRTRRAKYPEKNSARQKVWLAVLRGIIKKTACICGQTKVEAHHTDYSKPLDVQWLCFKCHRELGHKQITAKSLA